MASLLPRITIAIVNPSVAQAVIPGTTVESYALAFRIAGRALELVGSFAWQIPRIESGARGTCVLVRIAAVDDANALDLADVLADAALSAARDPALIATHRIERIPS